MDKDIDSDADNLQEHRYVGATESLAPNKRCATESLDPAKWCKQFIAPTSKNCMSGNIFLLLVAPWCWRLYSTILTGADTIEKQIKMIYMWFVEPSNICTRFNISGLTGC
jgi:hypothetical protein